MAILRDCYNASAIYTKKLRFTIFYCLILLHPPVNQYIVLLAMRLTGKLVLFLQFLQEQAQNIMIYLLLLIA